MLLFYESLLHLFGNFFDIQNKTFLYNSNYDILDSEALKYLDRMIQQLVEEDLALVVMIFWLSYSIMLRIIYIKYKLKIKKI